MIWIRHHKWVSYYQIPVAARFENADICIASSGSDTTNIQLFCPNLLHGVANVLGHIKVSPMTVLVQNSCLLLHKLVSYPLILTKFPFWHPLYTGLFVIVTAVCLFQANCSLFLATCVYGNGYVLCKPLQGYDWLGMRLARDGVSQGWG